MNHMTPQRVKGTGQVTFATSPALVQTTSHPDQRERNIHHCQFSEDEKSLELPLAPLGHNSPWTESLSFSASEIADRSARFDSSLPTGGFVLSARDCGILRKYR